MDSMTYCYCSACREWVLYEGGVDFVSKHEIPYSKDIFDRRVKVVIYGVWLCSLCVERLSKEATKKESA